MEVVQKDIEAFLERIEPVGLSEEHRQTLLWEFTVNRKDYSYAVVEAYEKARIDGKVLAMKERAARKRAATKGEE